jgi:hypothetical protein
MKKLVKKTLAFAGCLAVLAVPLAAQAYDNAPRDSQYMTSDHEDNRVAPNAVRTNVGYTTASTYNHDTEARNRGDSATGANMGPGGRNSGFDDNEALHGSSSRHINDTNIDGSDANNAANQTRTSW